MRILILGPNFDRVAEVLDGARCVGYNERLTADVLATTKSDAAISFGYRHIIHAEVLRSVEIPIVNVHISLLPWNRGADPNLWSWLENTPKGVSIHWMAREVDRGDLFAQQAVGLDASHTLRTSYAALVDSALELLGSTWSALKAASPNREPQPSGGSYHRSADRDRHLAALTDGWDTPCRHLLAYGKQHGLWLTHG